MLAFHKIFALIGTALFLYCAYAWLFVSSEFFMSMVIGFLIAGHHYMHYKNTKQIQQERTLNYMTLDAVRAAWGDEGIKRLRTVAGQRFIDNAPEDIKRDCAEIVKEALEKVEAYEQEESKSFKEGASRK